VASGDRHLRSKDPDLTRARGDETIPGNSSMSHCSFDMSQYIVGEDPSDLESRDLILSLFF
jgi:hypothetical protein